MESWAWSEPHLAGEDQYAPRKTCDAGLDYVQSMHAKAPRSTGKIKTKPATSHATLRIILLCA